jgi:NADH-quinone oxidoreductase subunit J
MIIYFINLTILLLLISAFMTVYSYNPIYSALFLNLTYILAAGLLLLLKFEFIALIIIIVYVGAISVLFLFVIFMIDVKWHSLKHSNFFYFYSVFFSIFSFFELFLLLFKNFFSNSYQKEYFFFNTMNYSNWILKNDLLFDLEVIGQLLSTNFIIHLLLIGLILFLGILGSIAIIFSFKDSKTKLQLTFKQLSKKNGYLYI